MWLVLDNEKKCDLHVVAYDQEEEKWALCYRQANGTYYYIDYTDTIAQALTQM